MKITIDLTQKMIDDAMKGCDDPQDFTTNLFKIAIPHFDYAERIKIGAVSVSGTTAQYIVKLMCKIKPGSGMLWVNYGFSTKFKGIDDWKAVIDMKKITYPQE